MTVILRPIFLVSILLTGGVAHAEEMNANELRQFLEDMVARRIEAEAISSLERKAFSEIQIREMTTSPEFRKFLSDVVKHPTTQSAISKLLKRTTDPKAMASFKARKRNDNAQRYSTAESERQEELQRQWVLRMKDRQLASKDRPWLGRISDFIFQRNSSVSED